MSKKELSTEYKRKCVELVILHRYKYKEAASAINVSLSSMQHWITQYKKEQLGNI